MKQTIRTFIALPLPELVTKRIYGIQEQLKPYRLPVRWVKPENVHLTLKFLGEVSAGTIDDIVEAIKDTVRECSPLLLHAKGLGVFPGIKRPRILWFGISGDVILLSGIQAKLETNLEKKGFPKENRLFKSHLTLGRVKGDIHPENLVDILRSFSDFTSESFEAKELILYQSELKPSGALYTKLQTIYLDGPKQSD
jgi:RNA 2',3'-cyclic 3'-phosphodiesterase